MRTFGACGGRVRMHPVHPPPPLVTGLVGSIACKSSTRNYKAKKKAFSLDKIRVQNVEINWFLVITIDFEVLLFVQRDKQKTRDLV